MKVLGGAILGFGLGWWATILKEGRERKQLRQALYKELANCYEAVHYHLEPARIDYGYLKTKLKNDLSLVAYDAATKNAAALYSYPEHGYFIGCYRELKKLTEITMDSDDEELIKTLRLTLGMIEDPTNGSVRKNLLKYLPATYHKHVKARGR